MSDCYCFDFFFQRPGLSVHCIYLSTGIEFFEILRPVVLFSVNGIVPKCSFAVYTRCSFLQDTAESFMW